mmetsp:Transcript_107891/g.315428  ORF Transcript_107891/g.315428 Transcript_107891/m.315428 type:complete len:277 (-) Transcript_107891:198-1028(-)
MDCPVEDGSQQFKPLGTLGRQPWAFALPVMSGSAFIVLIVIVHAMALSSGKMSHEVGGNRVTVAVPEISSSAARSPESWIWTCGVLLTFIFLQCPSLLLISEVLRCQRFGGRWVAVRLAKLLLVVGSIALVGLAVVTTRGTVLEEEVKVPDGAAVHQAFMLIFFFCSFSHVSIVVFLQVPCPCYGPQRREAVLSPASRIVKATLFLLLILSASQAVPMVALLMCPASVCHPEVRGTNLRGLTQRSSVFWIACFIASYSLDVRSLLRNSASETVPDS